MTLEEYTQLDATALSTLIRNNELSTSEAESLARDAIAKVNPSINAVVCDTQVEPQAEAKASTLYGVPTGIKDNSELGGYPCLFGSRAVPKKPVKKSGPFVEQLLATGMAPVVKTTLPEYGLTATTEYSQSEPTRNPWNLNHSTGGSSGGSAALVAAGALPIAHANDGGGSIRIPAACCGVVGLKPSRSRLKDETAATMLPINIVAEGVVTRSVRDTAAFYAEMEKVHYNSALPKIGHITSANTKRLRIAVFTDFQGDGESSPEVQQAIEKVAQTCTELGHHVTPISTPVNPQMADDFFLYWATLAMAIEHGGKLMVDWAFDRDQLEPLTTNLSRHTKKNLWKIPGAINRLKAYQETYAQHFTNFDLLLTPTLATEPKPLGEVGPDVEFELLKERLFSYTAFTPVQNVSGAPAISLPLCQSENGLPIGIQFAAPIGQEQRLLEIAYEMEEAMPWNYSGIQL